MNRLAALSIVTPLALFTIAGTALAQPPSRATTAGAAARPGAAGEASLPIKRITLYRSGVGYFQRAGSVGPGDRVQLRFATDQINDMLKSMVILDQQQALQSVSYGSKDP